MDHIKTFVQPSDAELVAVKQAFSEWRREARSQRGWVPADLRQRALKLLGSVPRERLARVLGVSPRRLRRWEIGASAHTTRAATLRERTVSRRSRDAARSPAFIDVSAMLRGPEASHDDAPAVVTPGLVVEVRGPTGAVLRLRGAVDRHIVEGLARMVCGRLRAVGDAS